MYNLKLKNLGKYDVAICGGGIAGVGAALSAARAGASVVLIESQSSLGGTMTAGLMCNIIDGENKGGLIKEILDFLNERELTLAHRGARFDENGKKRPGRLIDVEATKYFLEKACMDVGVKLLYSSTVAGVDKTDEHINSIFLTTYCGNYELSANVYIDASGNGNLSELADLKWECGNPPNPASLGLFVTGMPSDYNGTDSQEEKEARAHEYEKTVGASLPSEYLTFKKLPSLDSWCVGYNFEYDVTPDDIERYSEAIIHARAEGFELIENHKKIPGYERVNAITSNSYFGVREGRRIFGLYRISVDDITSGRKHDDGICLVTATVDVHKLHEGDTTECQRGVKSKPYHIPYRALVPLGCDNMLLAGRLISGDFYPFASYRMIGNMATVGEAAGYAAALCSVRNISPKALNGCEVRRYMESLGHEI